MRKLLIILPVVLLLAFSGLRASAGVLSMDFPPFPADAPTDSQIVWVIGYSDRTNTYFLDFRKSTISYPASVRAAITINPSVGNEYGAHGELRYKANGASVFDFVKSYVLENGQWVATTNFNLQVGTAGYRDGGRESSQNERMATLVACSLPVYDVHGNFVYRPSATDHQGIGTGAFGGFFSSGVISSIFFNYILPVVGLVAIVFVAVFGFRKGWGFLREQVR